MQTQRQVLLGVYGQMRSFSTRSEHKMEFWFDVLQSKKKSSA